MATVIRRPFSGPVISPADRHAPPGTPFKHGHGPLLEPREPSGLPRADASVGFVSHESESRTGTPVTAKRPVDSETYEQLVAQGLVRGVPHHHQQQRGPRTTTPAQTVAPRVQRRYFRPRNPI